MFNIIKKEVEWGGKVFSLETGKIARQASGAVIAKYGDSIVLCTVAKAKKEIPDIDFVPLTVEYIEKSYAAARILGGFKKRETRPSDLETLTARLIDRPIRPLVDGNWRYDTQIVCTTLAFDSEASIKIAALVGASAALAISEVPFAGPIASAEVGYLDGQYILNPNEEQQEHSDLFLTVAGTKDSVLMVESEAKELSEEVMLGAVDFGHQAMQPLLSMVEEFAQAAAKSKIQPTVSADDAELRNQIAEQFGDRLREAFTIHDKLPRNTAIEQIKEEVLAAFVNDEVSSERLNFAFAALESQIVRQKILQQGERIDGRKVDEVRPISTEVGILPVVHGSALFTRGETQALAVTTLGGSGDEQMFDTLAEAGQKERFMLHYNFPPYCVGEVGQIKTGRRELGHGNLARKALKYLLPSSEEFPYVIRVVSEITESNGSSSMATVCSSSMSLMNAGVPLRKPVSGIAMGLIKDGEQFTVLSDIMGDEDHLGDMDFKVAGTADGITALQMDIKCSGVSSEIMRKALAQAHQGRLHILDKMAEAITAPAALPENAPKTKTITIPTSKIREVIGAQGKVIKGICEEFGVTINIEDDGRVQINGRSTEDVEATVQKIESITMELRLGGIYDGKVVKIIESGAFVSLPGGKDGFIHISELADYRVDFVDDILSEGQVIKAKMKGYDRQGRPKLSYRDVDQKTGADLHPEEKFEGRADSRPDGGRGNRGGNGGFHNNHRN